MSAYRKLRFESLEQCVAEVRRIVAASEAGRLVSSGQWTPGQILAHVAAWIEYGYQGYPIKPPPFFIRWVLRLRLRSMLERGMPRGVKIPGVPGGTIGADEVTTVAAAERLLVALRRLEQRQEAAFDSPAFGPMSHEDRVRLNLRHAELHLGHLSY
jgi:hypothetical protein